MKEIKSHITGVIVDILAQVGDHIQEGQEVLIIESMKMHIPLEAPVGGKVAKILAQPNQQVLEGEVLLYLEE